ncbi:PREDICTED: structural maintenance of chromosomes protein 6-like, partial [Eurypyga helias]|uniref:structural maintenance of chromosomes protein 6-like n=1 Tax=Eurypyga helias TaxID=54383 RepID=UPI000528949D
FLSLRCKLSFDRLLCIRACSGKILFDHKNETLSITVQPREEDKSALNDVRSLSGGERSFSTVCFILSLWSITESPFRCLDEFDVCMDMVNRRIAVDMILKVADSQHHRQFILLTPQIMRIKGKYWGEGRSHTTRTWQKSGTQVQWDCPGQPRHYNIIMSRVFGSSRFPDEPGVSQTVLRYDT